MPRSKIARDLGGSPTLFQDNKAAIEDEEISIEKHNSKRKTLAESKIHFEGFVREVANPLCRLTISIQFFASV